MTENRGNREYKSDVFSMLMEDPNNALQLYNAVNGSAYTDAAMVEMCRLDGGISLSIRNDASFILDMRLSLYEHQSTVCPNMPIRSFVYLANILEGMIKNRNIYGRTLVKIPTPKFAIFYNGEEEQPEQYELKLSDAFLCPVEDPELELKCKVYNINYGKNKKLLEKCPFLREYMIFVDYVRQFHKELCYNRLEHAIELAIDRCIKENVLRDFLIEHRSEVVKVTTLDYTFERQLTLEREEKLAEGRAEGLAEGHAQGHAQGHAEGLAEGLTKGRAQGHAEGCSEGEMRKLIRQVCRKQKKGCSAEETADMLEEDEEIIRRIYCVIEVADEDDVDEIYSHMHKGNL